jgi:hypothetical protein
MCPYQPPLIELAKWGYKYDARVDKGDPNVKRFRADEKKAVRETLTRFEDVK